MYIPGRYIGLAKEVKVDTQMIALSTMPSSFVIARASVGRLCSELDL